MLKPYLDLDSDGNLYFGLYGDIGAICFASNSSIRDSSFKFAFRIKNKLYCYDDYGGLKLGI